MTDLEALLIADEDARARVDAVCADNTARREQARAEYESRRRAETDALAASIESEVAGIAAGADAEVVRREAARRERVTSVEARAATLSERAALLWVRIVEEGPVP